MQVNNNQFEIKPGSCRNKKRKYSTPCPTAYMNPALDLLANDDPISNNTMEVLSQKRRKRTKSCSEAVFDNSALDLGTKKTPFNEFLVTELGNVTKNLKPISNRSLEELNTLNSNMNIEELRKFKPFYSYNHGEMNCLRKCNSLDEHRGFVNKISSRLPIMPADAEKFDSMDFTFGDITLNDTLPTSANIVTEVAQINTRCYHDDLPKVIEINENISNVNKQLTVIQDLPPFMPDVSQIPKVCMPNYSEIRTPDVSEITNVSDFCDIEQRFSSHPPSSLIPSTYPELRHGTEFENLNDEILPRITQKSADLKLSDSPKASKITSSQIENTEKDVSSNPFDTNALLPIQNLPSSSKLSQIFINKQTNLSLSFIEKLDMESPSVSGQSLYLDDDLNESNIMEIKTITIVTKKRKKSDKKNTNPFLNNSLDEAVLTTATENPFLNIQTHQVIDSVYDDQDSGISNKKISKLDLIPKRLFENETNLGSNNTISTIYSTDNYMVDDDRETMNDNNASHIYENVDSFRAESPVYANITEDIVTDSLNKQSKIFGCDVSQFNSTDILNYPNLSANSNDSSDTKKDKRNPFLNKLSRKVLKKFKKTFKSDKSDQNVTLNPYEVPRKVPKAKKEQKDKGLENPGLKLDWSDEIEIEEIDDDEHQYETIKTARNTRLNMNLTPLKERNVQNFEYVLPTVTTPGKKQVRFDSTLNKEKVITGNSFDQTQFEDPGLDTVIDEFHDELENCINEKKFIAFNM